MFLNTGIPKLDESLNGGIAKNRSILFYSTPGVDNLPFAHQFLYNRLSQGDKGIYFVNNKKPDAVRFILDKFDWNLTEFEQKNIFSFVDCYSGLISFPSKEKYIVNDTSNLKEIIKKLKKSISDYKGTNTVLVFDALSSLLDLCGTEKEVLNFIEELLKISKKNNTTPVFLFTEWLYEKNVLNQLRGLFDCIIDLKAIERKVILRKYFSVSKANWLEKPVKKEIPFKILQPGGVKIYIPKVLVTGPFNAGKTSFIHSASTKAVSVDRLGTTVALDHGHVDYGGFSVDLWGTPGQERFDPILELLGGESLGVIVVVDSTDTTGFPRAKDMLVKTKTEGLPAVLIANKADLKGALKPEQIRQKMALPKEIPIVSVVADDLEQVKQMKTKQPCKLNEGDVHSVLSKLFEMVV